MPFTPKKFLHGLLYTTPAILLALAACGGSGGTSTMSPTSEFFLGGITSGLTSDGLVLLNNGVDALGVASGVMGFTFSTPLAASASYAVTVRDDPSTRQPLKDAPSRMGLALCQLPLLQMC